MTLVCLHNNSSIGETFPYQYLRTQPQIGSFVSYLFVLFCLVLFFLCVWWGFLCNCIPTRHVLFNCLLNAQLTRYFKATLIIPVNSRQPELFRNLSRKRSYARLSLPLCCSISTTKVYASTTPKQWIALQLQSVSTVICRHESLQWCC